MAAKRAGRRAPSAAERESKMRQLERLSRARWHDGTTLDSVIEAQVWIARQLLRQGLEDDQDLVEVLAQRINLTSGLPFSDAVAAAQGDARDRARVLANHFLALERRLTAGDAPRDVVDYVALAWDALLCERLLETREADARRVLLQAIDATARGDQGSWATALAQFERVTEEIRDGLSGVVEMWLDTVPGPRGRRGGKWARLARLTKGTPLQLSEGRWRALAGELDLSREPIASEVPSIRSGGDREKKS